MFAQGVDKTVILSCIVKFVSNIRALAVEVSEFFMKECSYFFASMDYYN